jgi:ECF transporter S component (folate family)
MNQLTRIKQFFLQSSGELKNLRSLTLASLLTALYAVTYSPVAGNIMIVPGVIEIRLGHVVIAVAGMMFGPVVGALVAALGDLIGALLFYGGSFVFGYTLVWAVAGFGFGCILYRMHVSMPRLLWAAAFYEVVICHLLNTLMLVVVGVGPFWELLISRFVLRLIKMPVNVILLVLVLRTVHGVYSRMMRTAPQK